MKKQSYKILWNVFLMVICGGSLIFGFVQHKKWVEDRVLKEECEQRIESLRKEAEVANAQLELALKQLQIEKDMAAKALQDSNKSSK